MSSPISPTSVPAARAASRSGSTRRTVSSSRRVACPGRGRAARGDCYGPLHGPCRCVCHAGARHLQPSIRLHLRRSPAAGDRAGNFRMVVRREAFEEQRRFQSSLFVAALCGRTPCRAGSRHRNVEHEGFSCITARLTPGVGVIDGVLYAVSGDETDAPPTVEAYDPRTDTWSQQGPIPAATLFRRGWCRGQRRCSTPWSAGVSLAVVIRLRSVAVHAYDPTTDTWSRQGFGPDEA